MTEPYPFPTSADEFADKRVLVTGGTRGIGAAEQLTRLVPKGRVVTAFTSISSALIRDPASGEKPTVFTCAGDEAARSIVIALANEIGLEGVDAGHLDASRNIENLDLLVGQLAYGSGFGNRVTCALM